MRKSQDSFVVAAKPAFSKKSPLPLDRVQIYPTRYSSGMEETTEQEPQRANFKCPSCRESMPQAEEECPHCRLTLRRLDLKFGAIPLHSRYLTDRAECLPIAEVKKVMRLLQAFGKKFPQLLFSVFIADLPPGRSTHEFAFWLANRGRFSRLDAVGADNFDLLLVIDVGARSAALTAGYGLEEHLSEEDLEDALSAAFPHFRDGDIAGGIRGCVEWMTQHLRALSRKTAQLKTLDNRSAKMTEASLP